MSHPQQPFPAGAPEQFHGAPPVHPQPYAPQQYAVPQPAGGVVACRMCGSVPAAQATFRGHQGFLIVMRFLSQQGPFCRDCGLATFRSMTARTLIQGWYGWLSLLITPVTVLINLARRGRVAGLAAPGPHPYGPSRRPMDPGARLLQRPTAIIGLVIGLVLISLIVFAISRDS